MGRPAAKRGDRVFGIHVHLVQPPPPAPSPLPVPYPFTGALNGQLSRNVRIERKPAAKFGTTTRNVPPHIPPAMPFVRPPSNQGRVIFGSLTVRINHVPAARAWDLVLTCNDPVDAPFAWILASSRVRIGG